MASLLLAAVLAAPETLARFAGIARINAGCRSVAAALSEDMPTPGYANRFRLVLTGPGCLRPGQIGPIPVRVAATERGSMTVEVVGWFDLDVMPGDPLLQEQLSSVAPVAETRLQWVTVTETGRRRLQVLIEEPR